MVPVKRLLLLSLLAATSVYGGTYTAKTANYVDVNGCLNDRSQCKEGGTDTTTLQDGDTLNVPTGDVIWSNTLNINKAIQFIGAGMDETHATPTSANATIITSTVANGTLIQTTYPASGVDFVSRISGFVLNKRTVGTNYLLRLQGQSYRHTFSHTGHTDGSIKGGLRVDHVRFRNDGLTTDDGRLVVLWSAKDGSGFAPYYVTGSFDHNFYDYTTQISPTTGEVLGTPGAENNSFSNSGTPGTAPTPKAGDWGQFDWNQDYSFGGGDNTELSVIYLEDNIFHRVGFDMGALGGGGRLVIRHNTTWGGLNTHGMESGNNMGTPSIEFYNNYVIARRRIDTNAYYNGAGSNWRGGSAVHFNNRFVNYQQGGGAGGTATVLALQISRTSSSISIVGPANGKNFFDQNCKGTISANGKSFTPISGGVVADGRVGDIYASGTVFAKNATNDYSLTIVNGTTPAAGDWVNFVLLDKDNEGGDGPPSPVVGATVTAFARINSNDGNNPCRVTVDAGANKQFAMAATANWELRRVQTYFGIPGSGKVPIVLNGGNTNNGVPSGTVETAGTTYITANGAGQVKYWGGVAGFGLWQKANRAKNTASTPWGTGTSDGITMSNSSSALVIPGGIHDEALPSYRKNDGGSGSFPYPSVTPAPTPSLRVGADWDAPGFSKCTAPQTPFNCEGIEGGGDGSPTIAYGAAYPNAMVGPTPTPTPTITSQSQTTFTAGVTPTPPPSAKNYFQVTTQNFSGTPTFAATGTNPGETWPISANITLNSSTGVLSGTATGVTAATYKFTIKASHTGDTDATQQFSLTIQSPNTAPTVNITSPADGFNAGTAPKDIAISATASDNGTVNKFDFLQRTHGGSTYTSLTGNTAGDCSTGCIAVTPQSTQSYTFTWTNVAAGSYDIVAKAYDDQNLSGQSAPVQVTVSSGGAGNNPTPATINIRP
jgi:hypothetical protein